MPISNQYDSLEIGNFALWKIEESVTVLESYLKLTPTQKKALNQRQTENGKKGFLAVRAALVHLGKPLSDLTTDALGAPILLHNHCSFTHTPDYAAVLVDKSPVGIDMEYYRSKIKRIATKFVHTNERPFVPENDQIQWLTRLWTAKEALYKAVKKPGLSLHQQIEVTPFSMEDKKGSAHVQLGEETLHFDLQFRTFKDHQLTAAKLQTHERFH